MNINRVSSNFNFGKTVRVNLSSNDAFKLANIINSSKKSQVKKLISTTEKNYILSPYNDIIDGVRRLYKMCVTKK